MSIPRARSSVSPTLVAVGKDLTVLSSYLAALMSEVSTRRVADVEAFERLCMLSPVGVAAVSLDDLDLARGCAAVAAAHRIPWIGLAAGDPAIAELAYGLGSVAALPSTAGGVAALRRLLDDLLHVAPGWSHSASPSPARRNAHRRDDVIDLAPEQILTVHRGLVAAAALYPDGSDVLLGLYPAGDVVVGASLSREWAFRLTAHTDCQTSTRPSSDVLNCPELLDRMIAAARATTAWSAAQACMPTDRRLLAILHELARRLGRRHEDRIVIEARLTATDLGRAIGASRATVVRTSSLLRRRGALCSGEPGGRRRWALPILDASPAAPARVRARTQPAPPLPSDRLIIGAGR